MKHKQALIYLTGKNVSIYNVQNVCALCLPYGFAMANKLIVTNIS